MSIILAVELTNPGISVTCAAGQSDLCSAGITGSGTFSRIKFSGEFDYEQKQFTMQPTLEIGAIILSLEANLKIGDFFECTLSEPVTYSIYTPDTPSFSKIIFWNNN